MRKIALLLAMISGMMAVQAQEFDYNFSAGLSMSQIDGDGAGSYNRFGYMVGVSSSFPLGENSNFRMLVEVGLVQKGSTIPHLNRNIGLSYLELPLMVTYTPLLGNDMDLRLGLGVAPAYLFGASVKDNGVQNSSQEQNYRKMDRLPLCMDALLRKNHWGIGVRLYNSMLGVTKEAATGTYRIWRSNMGVFNRNVAVYLNYNLD